MARQLTFKLKQKEYTATPVKVERKKLYGWSEIAAEDESGNPCKLATTDDTGTLIIPKGGTALGIISAKGKWVNRSELKYVNDDGTDAQKIPSSYSGIVDLKDKIDETVLLDYSITDFYQLTDIPSAFIKAVGKSIYKFSYSYLDSYEASPAFIMESSGVLFMLVGYRNYFEMQCLKDCGDLTDNDDIMDITDDDDIDFTML